MITIRTAVPTSGILLAATVLTGCTTPPETPPIPSASPTDGVPAVGSILPTVEGYRVTDAKDSMVRAGISPDQIQWKTIYVRDVVSESWFTGGDWRVCWQEPMPGERWQAGTQVVILKAIQNGDICPGRWDTYTRPPAPAPTSATPSPATQQPASSSGGGAGTYGSGTDDVTAQHAWDMLSRADQLNMCRIYGQYGVIRVGATFMNLGKTPEEAAALVKVVAAECT